MQIDHVPRLIRRVGNLGPVFLRQIQVINRVVRSKVRTRQVVITLHH